MKKIRVLFIINLLFLILFSYELLKTYAVFESDVTGEVSNQLAVWKVIVNGTDIVTSNTFDLADVSWDTSLKVLSNKAAPGLGGSFDIVISSSDVEVAFRYDITFDFSSLVNQEFMVDSITDINGGELVRTDENVYSGIFTLEDIENGRIADVKVNLLWNNNEDNNENDYELGSVYDNQITIPVDVHVIQYTGEELETYITN